MRYNRLIRIVLENNLFESEETFNLVQFQDALIKKNLLDLFNETYWHDTNCRSYWLMWDFSDRFERFARALCSIGYCRKVSRGLYKKN